MAAGLEIRFVGGRYHATAWGRHVNEEGAMDWPPSPWRIFRTLLSVWITRSPEVEGSAMAALLEALTQEYPQYHIPPVAPGQTRHYMPVKGKPILVFDSFLALTPADPVRVVWPHTYLTPDSHRLLAELADRIQYLGRAESWARASALTADAAARYAADSADVVPLADLPATSTGDHIRLLAPDLGQSGTRLITVLSQTSQELRQKGFMYPHNTSLVPYVRAAGKPRVPRVDPGNAHRIQSARYSVVPANGSPNVLYAITDALLLTELLRRALVDKTDGSSVMAGKDGSGAPLQNHRHAHYVALDSTQQGKISELVVWASGGFGPTDIAALQNIRLLRSWRLPYPVRLVLTDLGGNLPASLCANPHSSVWESVTPLVLPRYPKTNHRLPNGDYADSPRIQLMKELAYRGYPEPVEISELAHYAPRGKAGGHSYRWLEFKTQREKDRGTPRPVCGFRIRFGTPIRGPLLLGYGAHFGLGLFRPG